MADARRILDTRYAQAGDALATARESGWDDALARPLTVLTKMVVQVIFRQVAEHLEDGEAIVADGRARRDELLELLRAAASADAGSDAQAAAIDRARELLDAEHRHVVGELLPALEEEGVDLDEVGDLLSIFDK